MLSSLALLFDVSSLPPAPLFSFRPQPSGILSFTPFYLFCVLISDATLCVLISDVTLDLTVLSLCCSWAKEVVSDADS